MFCQFLAQAGASGTPAPYREPGIIPPGLVEFDAWRNITYRPPTQIDPKYFDGTLPLSVQAIRDHACEDASPKLVPQLGPDQATGTYVLTDAFKNSPPPKIKKLECYDATGKK